LGRPWEARLVLAFAGDGTGTVAARREHYGPLLIQKPLYPEGPHVCQCVILHPPGGIAGGDALALDIGVGARAFAQFTTPGATKWYRCEEAAASQTVLARVAEGAVLEWLPQGTIVYDGARASSELRFELARDATLIASDVVCLGRRASGERFRCGEWRQRFEIVREGALVWSERALLAAASPLLVSSAGLNGASVFGTFVASGKILDATLSALRGIMPPTGDGAVTKLPDLVVARYRGDSMQSASAWFFALWCALRPALAHRAALRPRIWTT
jgi:urease accessory protein